MSNIKTQVYRPRQSSFVDRMNMSQSQSNFKPRPSSGVKYAAKTRPVSGYQTGYLN